MTDYNSDQAKELRRARLLTIKPKAAPMMLNESAFNREYVEYRFVAVEQLANLEEANNIMFCPACAKDLNTVMVKRRVLHVSYEDDPLGNFPLIAVAKCQGCEWEEMIPVVKQELQQEEQHLLRRFHRAQAATVGIGKMHSSGLLDASRWSDEMIRQMKPGMIVSGSPGSKIEYMPPEPSRFGQAKADRAWADMSKNEQERRDLGIARMQLDRIEQFEAGERARTQARAVGKSAMLAQGYGMGQARLSNYMSQYSQEAAAQMAKQIDADLMRGLQNVGFTHDEITALKREPAQAAKAAHKTLGDHIKILREKFDKKDRK